MTESTKPQPRVRVGVVVTNGDHILLAEHKRGDRKCFMLPGGGVEWWEPLKEAALRECLEEVCLDVTLNEVIVVAETRNQERNTHNVHFVFDTAAWGGTPEVGTDPDICDVIWYPISRLTEIDLYPPIAGPLMAALQARTPGLQFVGDLWHELF